MTAEVVLHDTAAMRSDFDSLEQKIDQVLALCCKLNTENSALRVQVASLDKEKCDLAERMETARVRLEALMAKLPQE